MAKPYSTAAQVTDKDLSRLITQAGWVDADVEDRIKEGDAEIESCLAGMGYDLTLISSTVALVNRLSILYGRYAVSRDIHHNFAPSQSAGEGFNHFLDRYKDILKRLKDRLIELVDSTGTIIAITTIGNRVQINTDNVNRAMTMGQPESERLDPSYDDQRVTADPDAADEEDC